MRRLPVKISVDRLFSRAVEAIEIDERLALREELKERYPKGAHAVVKITKITHGVYVEGFVDGIERETCVRCLEPFFREAHVEVAEPYSEDVAPHDAQFSDVAPLVDRAIDLDELVSELLEVDEPIAAVCRESCLGICAECGGNRNLGECACGAKMKL
jgi:uncharacterized protein